MKIYLWAIPEEWSLFQIQRIRFGRSGCLPTGTECLHILSSYISPTRRRSDDLKESEAIEEYWLKERREKINQLVSTQWLANRRYNSDLTYLNNGLSLEKSPLSDPKPNIVLKIEMQWRETLNIFTPHLGTSVLFIFLKIWICPNNSSFQFD